MQDTTVRDVPPALGNPELARRLAGRRPAVFLDYDGVLSPIVERPEDAVMSERMRTVVRDLAGRVPVCVVTGRDRTVAQQLMGIDDLTIAGSHGFDIWTPTRGALSDAYVAQYTDLVAEVTTRLRDETRGIPGAHVEPKRASVAVHYRQVDPADRHRISATVQTVMDAYSGKLKLTPGKMVYELGPNVDWNKGKAVLYLIDVLGLDSDDIVPLYLGDDITDEYAFQALRDRGIGILVGDPDDPEVANRTTAARYALASVDDVERFLATLT
ncbi:trehalose-phosphatase [Rhodococcus sp. O3]|uniref:trehalose-phosphatase n=1 Tax=Rhodococcus sp. O3 TaxID=3404919 RepID=UPI003B6772A5